MYRRLYAQPSRARGPHGALSTASWRRRQGGAQPEAGGGNDSETGSTRVVHWHLRANYANGRKSDIDPTAALAGERGCSSNGSGHRTRHAQVLDCLDGIPGRPRCRERTRQPDSQAIIFDGMYSFVDVVPTVVSLLVVKLIARGYSHRFQYGYWHLEPLVAVLRDSILAVACIYAAIDAVNALSSGGHEVEYGLAAMWAGILCVIGLAMTLLLRRTREGASVADARSRCAELGW